MRTDGSDRLTITSRPWLTWLIGLLFAAVGLYMLLSPEGSLFGAIFLAAGLAVLLIFGRISSLTLDRLAGTATLRQLGLPPSRREVPLAEVAGAAVESSRSSRSGSTYRVVLVLHSGARLPMSSFYESGWPGKNAQADQINHFLGAGKPLSADAFGPVSGAPNAGVTDGIAWQVEARPGGESMPVTRWHAGRAGLQGGFLLLLQTQYKVPGLGPGGGLVASVARKAYEMTISAYGYDPSEIPGLSQAVSVEGQDPALADHFVTFTTQSEGARRWLNDETCRILVAFAEGHPPRGATDGHSGSLCIVTAPYGVWISVLGVDQDPAQIDDMTRLGVALVRAHAASETAPISALDTQP